MVESNDKEFYEKLIANEGKSDAERLKELHNMFTVQANMLGMKYILFTKDEVVNKNIKNGSRFIKGLDKEWRKYEEKVFIAIDGYDDDANNELYEIQEVREFIQALVRKHPQMLYYLSTATESLQLVLSCLGDVTVMKPIGLEPFMDKLKANQHRLDEVKYQELVADVTVDVKLNNELINEIIIGYYEFFTSKDLDGALVADVLTDKISRYR